jgi:hypothetical protein
VIDLPCRRTNIWRLLQLRNYVWKQDFRWKKCCGLGLLPCVNWTKSNVQLLWLAWIKSRQSGQQALIVCHLQSIREALIKSLHRKTLRAFFWFSGKNGSFSAWNATFLALFSQFFVFRTQLYCDHLLCFVRRYFPCWIDSQKAARHERRHRLGCCRWLPTTDVSCQSKAGIAPLVQFKPIGVSRKMCTKHWFQPGHSSQVGLWNLRYPTPDCK